jgi:hypothetical protein
MAVSAVLRGRYYDRVSRGHTADEQAAGWQVLYEMERRDERDRQRQQLHAATGNGSPGSGPNGRQPSRRPGCRPSALPTATCSTRPTERPASATGRYSPAATHMPAGTPAKSCWSTGRPTHGRHNRTANPI